MAPPDVEHVLRQHHTFLAGGGKGGTWQSMIASSESNLAWMREQNVKHLAPTLRTGRLAVGVPFGMYVAHDAECELPGEQANFHLCNLDGISLTGAMLQWADLSAVRCERADLSGADLRSGLLTDGLFSGSSFVGALLQACTACSQHPTTNTQHPTPHTLHPTPWPLLQAADLSRGDFMGCDFSNADLRGADLQDADFTHANLSGARLHGINGQRPNGAIFDPGVWDEEPFFRSSRGPKAPPSEKAIMEQELRLEALMEKNQQAGADSDSEGSDWSAMASNRANPTHPKRLKAVFDIFDKDKSGFVDTAELVAVLKELHIEKTAEEVEQLMKDSDVDGDGVIGFGEFEALFSKARAGSSLLAGVFAENGLFGASGFLGALAAAAAATAAGGGGSKKELSTLSPESGGEAEGTL